MELLIARATLVHLRQQNNDLVRAHSSPTYTRFGKENKEQDWKTESKDDGDANYFYVFKLKVIFAAIITRKPSLGGFVYRD